MYSAAVMVTTSLKIPHMLRVTTLVRCKREYSDVVIQNARHPGNMRSRMEMKLPFLAARSERPPRSALGPSAREAMVKRLTNMMGERKKSVANGLLVAGCRKRRI